MPPIQNTPLTENTPKAEKKLQKIIAYLKARPWLIAVIAVVILGLIAGAYMLTRKNPSPSVQSPKQTKQVKKKTTIPSPLTGVEVRPELANRPIYAAVIENHPDARPQSGLSQAGVVYEALAEGGITRFLGFFGDEQPANIGPVRSLRTYFIDWALEFNAPVAHAGGNADALDLVGPLGMKDMNQFAWGNYFYRSNDRVSPHNLYTSSSLLDKLAAVRGYDQPPKFTVSPRKADKPAETPTAGTINVNFSYNGYDAQFNYNKQGNDYTRLLAGANHIDRNTAKPIKVKNVIVEYMPTSFGTTRTGESTVIMQTVGTGKVLVFRDGGVVEGTWSKASHSARTRLLDAEGKEIPLNNGNSWYCIIPTDKQATYR